MSALPIGFVLLLNVLRNVPIGDLTRDPTATIGAPIYTGFLSQVGILFWAGAGAICMLSTTVASSISHKHVLTRFFFASALLIVLLGLDDAFLLHEEVFPYLGFAEEVVFASYTGLILIYLFAFRSFIFKTEYVLLGMGFLSFGMSVGLDVITPRGVDLLLLEDGAKLVGIVSWLVYFYRLATSVICQHVAQYHAFPRTD
jgi:hypothetical protein